MRGQTRRLTTAFLVLFPLVLVFIGWQGKPESHRQRQERLNNALILESERNDAIAVSELIREGANPNACEQPASLQERVEKDYPKTHLFLRYLSRDDEGLRTYDPALVVAVRLGNVNAAKALLAGGANVEQKDNLGETALELAKMNDGGKIYMMLKDADAKQQAEAHSAKNHQPVALK